MALLFSQRSTFQSRRFLLQRRDGSGSCLRVRVSGLASGPVRCQTAFRGQAPAFVDGLAGGIEDVGVHVSCVQIDAAVESVLLVVQTHGILAFVVLGRPDPASWLPGFGHG